MSSVLADSDIVWLTNNVYLEKSTFKDLKGWENENYKEAIDVFLKNCKGERTIKPFLLLGPSNQKYLQQKCHRVLPDMK